MSFALLGLLWSSAFAQDPSEGPAPLMQLDSLLVAPIRAPAERAAAAERLTSFLLGDLQTSSWDVARVEDAPPFQDYDAKTYMDACPAGRYAGCAMVVGQRMELDWAIAGELAPADAGDHLQITFVDLRGSQEVFSIGLTVAEGREEAVMRSVSALLERVVAGAFEAPDIRDVPTEDPAETARREKERAARIAANLDKLEQELGDVEIADVRRLEPVKLGMEDLERYRGAEGVTPWEQIGVSERAFVRYKNSGLDLETWKRRVAGRAGMVLLRAEVGGGRGASAESYHGWVALGDDLAVRETDALLETRNAAQFTAGAELGIGVLPWLELGGGLWTQTGTFAYVVDQDVEGDPVQIPSTPSTQPMGSIRYGGGATFAPLPARDARPTLTVQVTRWSGKGFTPPDDRLQRLPAPALTILEPAVGGEVRAHEHATLQARLGLTMPVGGVASYRDQAGDSALPTVIVPSGDPGVGWTLRVGVQARLGPLWGRR